MDVRKNFKRIMRVLQEKFMEILFFLCAVTSIFAVILICVFLFMNGIPAIGSIGIKEFILGQTWMPDNKLFGIFPMIMGSLYITAGAILVGVPIGILCSVFMAHYCPPVLYRLLKPGIELMAGIPSIVYGFFGLCVLVPFVRENFRDEYGGNGNSIVTASLLLGIMILPTIISVSESAIRAVPEKYYLGARALGASHERSIFLTVLPAAKSGIIAAVVLGIGRAIGETMAVIMVAGNQTRLPENMFEGVRTLTGNIVIEMGYATGLHRQALIATGVVLFIFILFINLSISFLKRKEATA